MYRGDDTIEVIGERVARTVLGSSDSEMVDLRAQRGVGVDVLDDLQQFFELKVFGGAEPDVIHLTDREVHRALNPGFFIVVASGVAGTDDHAVRVITNPQALIQTSGHEGALIDVRSTSSRVYRSSTGDRRSTSPPVAPL